MAADWVGTMVTAASVVGAAAFAALGTRGWATAQARREKRQAEKLYDAAYDYIIDLRRQLHQAEITPHDWPAALRDDE